MKIDTYIPQVETSIDDYVIDTLIKGADQNEYIRITKLAYDKIKEFIEQSDIPSDFFLRLVAKSGGCSGMIYKLGMDNNFTDTDRKFSFGSIDFVFDNKSLFYFMGITVDYVEDESGSGFTFVNPLNQHTCGCGH